MIAVVGAGPAGSYLSYLLARNGYEVSLFEEHKEVGTPVQCTGIVTDAITRYLRLPNHIILNKIRNVRVHSPNKSILEISLRRPDYILDRAGFDKHLSELAQDSGAKLFLSHRFLGLKDGHAVFKIGSAQKKVAYNMLVGSDGPLSEVARRSGLFKNRSFWYGYQAIIRTKNDNIIDFYPHIGSLAWIVPVDNKTARVGVMSQKNPKVVFSNFVRETHGRIMEIQAGLIPRWSTKIQIEKANIFLLGDAAAQVKATTGGGIVPGLHAATLLSKAMIEKKSYQRKVQLELFPELLVHSLIRSMLDRMRKEDYNQLVDECNNPNVKKILTTIDRDHSVTLLLRLLSAKPGFFKFFRAYL